MLTHEISFKSGCVYHCRVEDGYDVWKSLAHTFATYNIHQLKIDFYDMFKTALIQLAPEVHESHTSMITFGFQHINNLIEALYFVAVEKGVVIQKPSSECFPHKWAHKRVSAPQLLANYCKGENPHEMRDVIWEIFQSAVNVSWTGMSQRRRKRMISLFENLTDLVAAAYVITSK